MANKLRASVKAYLEPAFRDAGFAVNYPHFQRKRGAMLELVSLEHDKWGGGLYLEFTRHPAGDLHTSWGEVIAEASITVAHSDPATRIRLLANTERAGSPTSYFRYENFANDRQQCDALIEDVVKLLPQVWVWFDKDLLGPNLCAY